MPVSLFASTILYYGLKTQPLVRRTYYLKKLLLTRTSIIGTLGMYTMISSLSAKNERNN